MRLAMRVFRNFRFGGAALHCLWQITAIALSVVMTVEGSVPASAATPPEPVARLGGHMLALLKDAKPVAASPGSDAQPLTLTVVLNRSDQAGFDRYLQDVYDPHSPNYRRFLKLPEMTERFGPSQNTYDSVLGYLQRNGFTLVEGSANHLTLTVRGTRAGAERAFHVHIRDFESGGRRFFANDSEPAVPRSLALNIRAVAGLENAATPRPANILEDVDWRALGSSIFSAIAEIIARYPLPSLIIAGSLIFIIGAVINNSQPATSAANNDPLPILGAVPPASATGAGQKVGLLAFSNFQMSDVADWLALAGLPASRIGNLSQVHVNGGAPLGPEETDVLLGIEAILSFAPAAQLVVYDAPVTGVGTSFQTVLNAMVNDGVTIISNSFSYCEDQTTAADAQSIDAILATAAGLGISVFNATGDSGSACSDGSQNTIAVPADSPHATAVGGTTLNIGPANTYVSETWWDGSAAVPPSGQGGFGVSQFFSQPAYQAGLIAGPMRSVPDVVTTADPQLGYSVCQQDAGGCPLPNLSAGTSLTTAIWAGLTALINQSQGHNIGFLNPLAYPLEGTGAFHPAAGMGTDAAHVGLGSPNVGLLNLLLAGQAPGPADAFASLIAASPASPPRAPFLGTIPADGSSAAAIVVILQDANGNRVYGRNVSLSASAGSHAVITPPSGASNVANANGAVVFNVTDATPESVTFSATDTTDGLTLAHTIAVTFVGPPASAGGIVAQPGTVASDGTSTTTITVTLQDNHGNGVPAKQVTLFQGSGHSIVTSPSPAVTDANGHIQFTATDTIAESIVYTATDTTDNLPVPGSAPVTFTGSTTSCIAPPPTAAPGFTLTPWATGFTAQNFFYSNISWGGCPGAANPTFDRLGSAYVADFSNGNLYRFGSLGGAAASGNSLASLGLTLDQTVFGKDGSLYASHGATGAGASTGNVVQLDPNTGAAVKTLVSGLACPGPLAVDPLSGDLFFTSVCFGGVSSSALSRIVNPSSSNPTLTTYATLPSTPNGAIAFAPDGTMFVVSGYTGPQSIVQVAGTNKPSPPAMTTLSGINSDFWVTVGSSQATGAAQSLIVNSNGILESVDITTSPFTTTSLANGPALSSGVIGPDGCLYATTSDTVYKLTPSSGGCGTSSSPPTLTLSPATVSPNPAQGTATTFTATLTNISQPQGTPITLTVLGPNLQSILARSDANGHATFSYSGRFTGNDIVLGSVIVGSQQVLSNSVNVTWTAGAHTTFLSLNRSQGSGQPNAPMPVTGTLVDVSVSPYQPISNVSIAFHLTGQTCAGTTNSAGTASCTVTPTGAVGPYSLTANFAGTPRTFLPSSGNNVVNLLQPSLVVAPPAITKVFGTGSLIVGGTTSLSFTVNNPNTSVSLSGVNFTDTLPVALVVSTPNGLTGSCGGGTVTAVAGSGTISLAGATLAASASCTFSVSVTAIDDGIQTNSVTAGSANGGTGAVGTAGISTFRVPAIAKAFGSAQIFQSQSTSLTFTLNSSNTHRTLTGLAFSDTLPIGLVVSTPNGELTNCSGTVTAVAGSNSISLTGAALSPGQTCTVSVNVTAVGSGALVNTTSTLTSIQAPPAPAATASIVVVTTLDGSFQVSYAANPSAGESYINIINTGANGAPILGPGLGGASGNICVNVYAFDPAEEMISCCSCLITPNQVVNLGVNANLTVKTLTGVIPTSVTVKLLNTLAGVGGTATSCTNSATAAGGAAFPIVNGLVAYGTTPQPIGTIFNAVEHPFIPSTLSPAELASITNRCANIVGNGSLYGVCSTCRAGALGATKQ